MAVALRTFEELEREDVEVKAVLGGWRDGRRLVVLEDVLEAVVGKCRGGADAGPWGDGLGGAPAKVAEGRSGVGDSAEGGDAVGDDALQDAGVDLDLRGLGGGCGGCAKQSG